MSLFLTPVQRLTLSREQMRTALREGAGPRGGGSGSDWLLGLTSLTGSGGLLATLGRAWAGHPLRAAAGLAADAVQAVVRPLGRRHPVGLVLGALLAGGLLAYSRPWRWLLTPALLTALLPKLLAQAVALVPPQSWAALLAALASQTDRRTDPAPAAATPGGAQPATPSVPDPPAAPASERTSTVTGEPP
jgi:hypothetical protein